MEGLQRAGPPLRRRCAFGQAARRCVHHMPVEDQQLLGVIAPLGDFRSLAAPGEDAPQEIAGDLVPLKLEGERQAQPGGYDLGGEGAGGQHAVPGQGDARVPPAGNGQHLLPDVKAQPDGGRQGLAQRLPQTQHAVPAHRGAAAFASVLLFKPLKLILCHFHGVDLPEQNRVPLYPIAWKRGRPGGKRDFTAVEEKDIIKLCIYFFSKKQDRHAIKCRRCALQT